jgi:YbbR domain-containing protein
MATEANNWKMSWLIGIIAVLLGVNLYIYSNVFKEAKKGNYTKYKPKAESKKGEM